MTEAEWLAATDPQGMLAFLGGRANGRKLRLFAAACCWQLKGLLKDERCWHALGVSEQFADGCATPRQIAAAEREAREAAASMAWEAQVTMTLQQYAAKDASRAVEAAVRRRLDPGRVAALARAAFVSTPYQPKNQCPLLRDLFGHLFHAASAVNPDWLTWNGDTARKLAESAYSERTRYEGTLDAARLGMLADALEDADCTLAELLAHLRGPGPHVRGCWALDLVLGRT
jgi:nucleoid-associated protein YgaU